ncbi:hypothetical protein [Delftia sp.]|uniref:hypothetical protein n=1 Tax=Delftia sp. TaxID=1886637 RepID=UPI00338EDAFB
MFWTFPANTLAGALRPLGGIAFINSLGAVGRFHRPHRQELGRGPFHSPAAGLYLLAGTTLLAAALVLGVRARLAPALAAPSAA